MDETSKPKKKGEKHKVEKLRQADAVSIVAAMPKLARIHKVFDVKAFETDTTDHATAISTLIAAEAAVTEARQTLKVSGTKLGKGIKSARAGVLAAYGDDSEQVQLAGNKRLSQRKRAVRKPKAAKTTTPAAAPAATQTPATPATPVTPAAPATAADNAKAS